MCHEILWDQELCWLPETYFMFILKYQEERITAFGRGQWLFLLLKMLLYIIVNCYCWKHNSSVEKMSLHMKQNCWISICDTLIVTWVLNPSDRRSRSVKWKKINIDVYQKKVLNLAKNASLCLNNIIPPFSFLHVKQKVSYWVFHKDTLEATRLEYAIQQKYLQRRQKTSATRKVFTTLSLLWR